MRALTHSSGEVSLVACDAENVSLETSFASPPGSSLEVGFDGAPLKVKVRSCRRIGADSAARFRIEGRWVSLPRAARDALLHDEG